MGMEVVAPLIGFDWTFVMVLVTFFILYLILKKFFFEKVRTFMREREQKVVGSFENAEAANRVAEQRMLEYETKLAGIETERRKVLKEAKATADQQAQGILRDADERAAEILRQADREIKREREIAVEAMHDQVAMLAINLAEKLISKTLDEKEQLMFIDEIIKEGDTEVWIR